MVHPLPGKRFHGGPLLSRKCGQYLLQAGIGPGLQQNRCGCLSLRLQGIRKKPGQTVGGRLVLGRPGRPRCPPPKGVRPVAHRLLRAFPWRSGGGETGHGTDPRGADSGIDLHFPGGYRWKVFPLPSCAVYRRRRLRYKVMSREGKLPCSCGSQPGRRNHSLSIRRGAFRGRKGTEGLSPDQG